MLKCLVCVCTLNNILLTNEPSFSSPVPSKCQKARELFCTVRTQTGELKTKFPAEQYYRLVYYIHLLRLNKNVYSLCFEDAYVFTFRYHEHWRFVLQRLAFLATFVVYLETESLVTREEVAKILASM